MKLKKSLLLKTLSVVLVFIFFVLFLKALNVSLLTAILMMGAIISGVPAVLMLARMNIFFTLVEEGSAKAIMRLGGFERVIMQFKDRGIAKGGEKIKTATGEEIIAERGDVIEGADYHLFGGFRFLGIPLIHYLYNYSFRWATIRAQTGEIIKREEKIDFILVKDDVYVAETKSAESRGMVPLDITLLITARCVNPYKALFRAQDWMEMIINRSEAIFREYAASDNYENLIRKKQKAGGEIFKKLSKTGLIEIFKKEYGIEIRAIEMRDINPAGANKQLFEEKATKQWVAQQEAKMIATLAEAEKGRIETVYQTIKKFGDLGQAIRFMESIDKAGEKQGNWIIPFMDIKSAARSLLGEKGDALTQILKEENITYEELRDLIKKIKADEGGKK